jgi:hypothetical protein
MDETRIDHRRTAAGCIAVIALLGAAFALGRCSAPAEAQQTQLAPEPVVFLGYDFHTAAGKALADLEVYLQTVTTTSTIAPKTVKDNSKTITQPSNPIDHADKWDRLAQCETGGNWSANTGNGFGGGLQFMHQRSYSTWLSFGGAEFAPHPWEASREQQIDIADRVLADAGWRAWPGCSRRFGWL